MLNLTETRGKSDPVAALPASKRKEEFRKFFDAFAPRSEAWKRRNKYLYRSDWRYLRFLVPAEARVLVLGCGAGRLLAELRPASGVGIDFSEGMIHEARKSYPQYDFHVADVEQLSAIAPSLGGPFDYIVLADTLGYLEDVQACLAQVRLVCHRDSRVVIAEYSHLWEPLLRLGEWIGAKMRQPSLNYVGAVDVENLLDLTDFEQVKRERRMLFPYFLFGLGPLINNTIATLPIIQTLCLRFYSVARLANPGPRAESMSATVMIPCRNESGNIENAIKRLPIFCQDLEILFVEGNSSDNTYEECLRVKEAYARSHDIKVFKQPGKGKGDAVRKGFDEARGDVLIILDADLTVPPEDVPKFYDVINSGKADFVNGTRMVYPLEKEAMRFLNYLANRTFAFIFSFLLTTRLTDTLCGTKVLRKDDYIRIVRGRSYFGDFDPFGDFDLIFGAAKLNLKLLEVPVRYRARTYGTTQISRFRDGWQLLKMVVFAFMKMKVH
jgi:ubiquinone/menaquinone biosynthesis C-methylase UbiE